MILKKNTILGNKLYIILILFFLIFDLSVAEDKISSTPLINLEKIKPSFENLSEEKENLINQSTIKKTRFPGLT